MKSAIPRNTIVQAACEGKNNLNKGSVIESDLDKSKHSRKFQKREFRKMIERGDTDNASLFYCSSLN